MSRAIYYSPRQVGNPVLKHVKDVHLIQGEKTMKPDFLISEKCGVLFLSLKYYGLHPEYIHKRIESLGRSYESRILLVYSDIENPMASLTSLTRTCIRRDMTILVAWSNDEAGSYLSGLKSKSKFTGDQTVKTRIEKKVGDSYEDRLVNVLTKVPRVNKPDALGLARHYKTFKNLINNAEKVEELDGWGPTKSEQFKRSVNERFTLNNPNKL